MLRPAAVLLLGLSLGAPAHAASLRPFQTSVERMVSDAREARLEGELDRAEALLDHADAAAGHPDARILFERGLLAQRRDHAEAALDSLRRSASLDPSNDARFELAAILVGLGRWPESVTTLRRAFEERGASLTADMVLADVRFGALVGFTPFKDLIESVRSEEGSVLGKLRSRLERIEALARTLEDTMARLSRVTEALAELATAPWTPVAVLVLLVFIIAAGIGQMRLLPPPWTLFVSYPFAALLWHAAARVVTGGESDGMSTVTLTGLIVVAPALLALGVRFIARVRRRPKSSGDAAAPREVGRRIGGGVTLRPVPQPAPSEAEES